MQGGRLAAVLALTATLLVLQDTHGFVDLYRAYGSWNSYSTCDMFQAAEPDPSGSAHEATCAVKLLIVTNGTILGQTVACDGETATVHGKDFLYMELAQQGAVVTRLPGVHRAGGVYTFPGWRMVTAGDYDVKLILGSAATPNFLSGRVADALRQDYLWQTKALINDTLITLLETKLQKASLPQANAADAAGNRSPCSDGSRWKGQWVHLTNTSQGLACPPGVCSGNPATALQLDGTTNRDIGFSHVYVPWQCGPYTLYDGPACLAGKRLAFIGNSRTYQLMEYLKDHSSRYDRALSDMVNNGNSSAVQQTGHPAGRSHHHSRRVTGTGTHGAARSGEGVMASRAPAGPSGGGSSSSSSMPRMQLNKLSHRMGLRQVLAQTNLTQVLLDYDFLIINSLLHDIADFREEHVLKQAKSLGRWSFKMGPVTLGTSTCAPTNATKARLLKYQPVQQFEQAIRGFADELLRARAAIARAAAAASAKRSSTPGRAAAPTETLVALGRKGSAPTQQQLQQLPPRMARVVWLMHGYRPAPLPDPCFPNTLARMVCLQHLAIRELERAGVTIVDLATMEMDAPAHWFYDAVHLAGAGGDVKRWGSGLELMAVQLLLNSVCGAGSQVASA